MRTPAAGTCAPTAGQATLLLLLLRIHRSVSHRGRLCDRLRRCLLLLLTARLHAELGQLLTSRTILRPNAEAETREEVPSLRR
jgi:hypothetical protein